LIAFFIFTQLLILKSLKLFNILQEKRNSIIVIQLIMIKHLLTATGIMASMLLSAQKNFWTPVQNLSVAGKSGLKDRKTLPTEYKIFSLNVDGIKSELDKAQTVNSE
jgi:hypothetical protein